MVNQRDYRKGLSLLTVETDLNVDSKSANERGPFLVGSLGLSCLYKRFLFCLGCSSRPSTKYFFLTVRFLNSFVPMAQQASEAAVLGLLSLSMCFWLKLKRFSILFDNYLVPIY